MSPGGGVMCPQVEGNVSPGRGVMCPQVEGNVSLEWVGYSLLTLSPLSTRKGASG